MNKKVIKVPSYVEHMSDWKNYVMPKGHCIIDKGITGCGYTELCLGNNENVVLCSPRKLLLQNKSEQHQGERNILYIENDIKNYKDSNNFENEIRNHVIKCCIGEKIPCKVLVTYDSMFHIVKVLSGLGLLDKFIFVSDEFQSIFLDAYFKSEVELDFVEVLQKCPNVIYLSATPMLDKYLDRLNEFKDLPMYELDWSETDVVESLILKRKFTTNLTGECSKIIQSYLSGKYEMMIGKNNEIRISKEAVFYFNSITDIIRVIKKNKLHPLQVNIICADNIENKIKLSKLSYDLLGRKTKKNNIRFEIGKIPIPQKGEINKMFTFCTKTAYIGSDFYSDNARSFVFSDPNIECLALDISLDLPQIAGRQRDINNPFKNDITIFYRTTRKDKLLNHSEFLRLQEERRKSTNILLTLFGKATNDEKDKLIEKLKDSIIVSQYSRDFISISKHTNQPVYNNLIEIANERAWEVSQKDYQDKINVTKALENISTSISNYLDGDEKIAQEFLEKCFFVTGVFRDRMKLYCDFMDKYSGNKEIEDIIYYKIKDDRYRRYYNFYGTKGCKSREYIEKYLYEGMMNISKEEELMKIIYKSFKAGERYTKKYIKSKLEDICRDLNITTKLKATDLRRYFKLTRTKIQNPDISSKYDEGYRLESFNPPAISKQKEQ